jgi:hypothetical protein
LDAGLVKPVGSWAIQTCATGSVKVGVDVVVGVADGFDEVHR